MSLCGQEFEGSWQTFILFLGIWGSRMKLLLFWTVFSTFFVILKERILNAILHILSTFIHLVLCLIPINNRNINVSFLKIFWVKWIHIFAKWWQFFYIKQIYFKEKEYFPPFPQLPQLSFPSVCIIRTTLKK